MTDISVFWNNVVIWQNEKNKRHWERLYKIKRFISSIKCEWRQILSTKKNKETYEWKRFQMIEIVFKSAVTWIVSYFVCEHKVHSHSKFEKVFFSEIISHHNENTKKNNAEIYMLYLFPTQSAQKNVEWSSASNFGVSCSVQIQYNLHVEENEAKKKLPHAKKT